MYVVAGALQEVLAALREAKLPDTTVMFIVACREIHGNLAAYRRQLIIQTVRMDPSNSPGI